MTTTPVCFWLIKFCCLLKECVVFQARQVLEREFNNLLALGTDRRLEEVTSQAVALIKCNIFFNGSTVWPCYFPVPIEWGWQVFSTLSILAQEVQSTWGGDRAGDDGGLHGNATCWIPNALHVYAALYEFNAQETSPAWRCVKNLLCFSFYCVYLCACPSFCLWWLTNCTLCPVHPARPSPLPATPCPAPPTAPPRLDPSAVRTYSC